MVRVIVDLSDTCTVRSSATAEIVQADSHYVVQFHSRSLILVPIESSYGLPVNE